MRRTPTGPEALLYRNIHSPMNNALALHVECEGEQTFKMISSFVF